MANSLTPGRAARHEALFVRIEALVKQLEPVARSKPGQEVSAPVRSLAEDLLFEAREFRPRGERRGLVAALPDHAGLLAQLGQAVARLAAFEADHTGVNEASTLCWLFTDGAQQPVQRLHPAAPPKPPTDRELEELREKLTRFVAAKIVEGVRERLVALGVEPHVAGTRAAEVHERFGHS